MATIRRRWRAGEAARRLGGLNFAVRPGDSPVCLRRVEILPIEVDPPDRMRRRRMGGGIPEDHHFPADPGIAIGHVHHPAVDPDEDLGGGH